MCKACPPLSDFRICMDALPKFKQKACGESKSVSHNPVNDMPENTIYQKVIKLCTMYNMTIKELAKKAGVSPHTISSWKNSYTPSLITLQKVAQVFDKDFTFFIYIDTSKLPGKIIYHRVTHNLTLTQLACKLNVLRDTVADWEKGKNKPSQNNMRKLQSIFGKEFIL